MKTCLICGRKFYESKTLIKHYDKFHRRYDAYELAELPYEGGALGDDAIAESKRIKNTTIKSQSHTEEGKERIKMDYQFYTTNQNGRLLHAGVHKLGHFSHRTIEKLERKWRLWRYEYIKAHPGNYPLADERSLTPKYVTVFPINLPTQAMQFVLS